MATPVPNAKAQFFDASGNPLSGGKLYTFIAGTTTPLASYTDATEGVSNANPVILDSAGMANVWLGQSAYKLQLQNSAGSTLWTVDNVYGGSLLSGYLTAIERSAPSGVAGSDIFYPDSTAHRWKMINNNGTAKTVAALESDTFTTPTLTSPTTTGTDAGAETLQNKTLNGAASGNAVTLLNQQASAGALTGNAADQTVYTYTMPAVVGAGKGIRVKVIFIHSTGTASVTYKLIIGAVTVEAPAYANFSTAGTDKLEWEIFNNAGVQNAQNWQRSSVVNTGGVTNSPGESVGTAAVDLSAQQVVKFTFNVAATDQITPKFWRVELIQ
jgi:hypothetical protein